MDISEKWITGYFKRLTVKFQQILRFIVVLGFGLDDYKGVQPKPFYNSVIVKPRADSCTKEPLSLLGLQLESLR